MNSLAVEEKADSGGVYTLARAEGLHQLAKLSVALDLEVGLDAVLGLDLESEGRS